MIRPVQEALILAVGVVVLIAGCGQQAQPNVKKSRAIAAENIELRKELEQRSEEIEALKEQHGREIKKQEKLLAECMEENETLKKKSQQNIRDQVKGVLDAVMEENKKLRGENEQLKAQIEQLTTESERNKEGEK